MPTKTTKQVSTGRTVSNGGNNNLPDFVSCELSDEQKAYVKTHLPTIEEAQDVLDKLLRQGFKLSLRFEDRSMSMAAWLTGPAKDSDCSGLVLSGRGPSVLAALGVLFYKHFEVLSEDWRTADVAGSKRDSWG